MSLQLDPRHVRNPGPAPASASGAPLPEYGGPGGSLNSHLAHRALPAPRWSGMLVKAFIAALASVVMTMGAMVYHHLAPDGWRISQFIGDFTGEAKAAEMAASLQAEKAKTAALLEEQARMQKEVVKAQADGQARVAAAQSQAQQEVALMQGKVQVAMTAYQALYERSNKLAVVYAQTVQGVVQMRAEMARGNQGGSTVVANMADLIKGIGVFSGRADLVERADAMKQATTAAQAREMDAAMSRAMPEIDARAFVAQGLPDPAQLAAYMNFRPQAQQPPEIEIGERPVMSVRALRPAAAHE